MAAIARALFLAALFLGVTTSWGSSEEDPTPLKLSKNQLPKKYLPMALQKYREEATTTEDATASSTTQTPGELAELTPTDLTASEEELVEAMERTRKAATTLCVVIRPNNPYEKPYQVCEPQHYGYIKPPTQHYGYVKPEPEPVKYQATHAYRPQANYQPQAGYQEQPYQHSGYQQQPQAQSRPQEYSTYSYEPASHPVMVLPHVPVAEPYHVPSKPYKPSSPGYRSSGGPWDADELDTNPEELEGNAEGRSAYYGGGESYGYGDDKVSLIDYHKKKELSYLPLITKSYTKTKPLKYLKVLKDLKKDKYKIGYGGYEEEEYYKPQYHHPRPPTYGGYGHQEHSAEYGHKDSSHGLVITCQPSAVGYTGQQNQAELSKHMEALKNIYSQTEKLYNQHQLSSSPGEGGGYVAPSTYRSSSGAEEQGVKSGGWKEMEGRSGWKSEAEGHMRSAGKGWENSQAEETVRKSGGWEKSQAEGAMRKSGGWEKAPAEGALRSSGGWQSTQLDENVGKSLASSMGPSPTAGMMSQKELETTAAFRSAQNFAMQQEMQGNRM